MYKSNMSTSPCSLFLSGVMLSFACVICWYRCSGVLNITDIISLSYLKLHIINELSIVMLLLLYLFLISHIYTSFYSWFQPSNIHLGSWENPNWTGTVTFVYSYTFLSFRIEKERAITAFNVDKHPLSHRCGSYWFIWLSWYSCWDVLPNADSAAGEGQ